MEGLNSAVLQLQRTVNTSTSALQTQLETTIKKLDEIAGNFVSLYSDQCRDGNKPEKADNTGQETDSGSSEVEVAEN